MSKLYIVATPIGNPKDITLRALEILKDVDAIICEEYRVGSTLLKKYDIENELVQLNEHNEKEQTDYIINEFLLKDKSLALISDAGAPLFADPGNKLVLKCHKFNIKVVPIPGATSIMTAIMGAGSVKRFQYYGFLPANKEKRRKAIKTLPKNVDLIFLETPYRLKTLLADLTMLLGKNRRGIIAYKLTMPEEKFFFGTLIELQEMEIPKGEFVFILKKNEKIHRDPQ